MFYNESRTTMQFKAYRVPVRCWRCWKRYAFFAPYEFVDVLIFPCDRCSKVRATETYAGYREAESKYIDRHYLHADRNEDHRYRKEFLEIFETHWITERCSCGGYFRLNVPIRCPHCHVPELRFLRGRFEIVESPPLPVLQFTIPPEYANAQARPPWQPKAKV